ncbi:unnamed protein product [Onchocerca ochengi]|uniref:Thioredoxin domain-containing protein n=1 Tax=Onchocerca ochengi TaxID=42157 RepID=A0A182E5K4_ONCOC|nr:unnamed protein product [Onchocerca ochengi]
MAGKERSDRMDCLMCELIHCLRVTVSEGVSFMLLIHYALLLLKLTIPVKKNLNVVFLKRKITLHLEKARRNDDLKVDMEELEKALKKDELSTNHKENIRKLREQKRGIREIFTGKLAMIVVGVSVILVIILSGLREKKMRELESERKQTIGKARIGGSWELIDFDGKLGGSEQLKGNWLLLYFGFTHCPDVCPDSIEKMVEVVEILEKSEEKIKVIPVFISVDPERDTIKRVKEYCTEFSPKIKGYTGSKEQVAKVAKAFRVYYSQGPKADGNDYIVDHTVIMYLIDPDGDFHDYYGQNRSAQEIAKIIKLKVFKRDTMINKKSRWF